MNRSHVAHFVLQEAQTTIFEMSKMEWWAGGGRTHRWKDDRDFFFWSHRTEQTPSGGRRRKCDAVWSDPRHYELCKPWFVHKMGVKHSRRRAQSSFYFLLPVCIYISTQYIWTNVTFAPTPSTPRHPAQHGRPVRLPQSGILEFDILLNQSQSLEKEKKKRPFSLLSFISCFSRVKFVKFGSSVIWTD